MLNKNDEDKAGKSDSLKVFLMGGTKDSINIIKFLKENYDSVYILTTTITDYGAELAKKAGSDDIIAKPLLKEEMICILSNFDVNESENLECCVNEELAKFDLLIDATHPFAVNATLTAIESAKAVDVPYIRFERLITDFDDYGNKNKLHFVDSFEEAGKIIANDFKDKNILHLAGVNTIEEILSSNQIAKENFFVRVLPVKSSIEKCNTLGISGEYIIAMQGVFSKEFNKELMKEFNIQVIITKESGSTGGVPSKIAAAHELGIDIVLINRPKVSKSDQNNIVNNLLQLKKRLNLL